MRCEITVGTEKRKQLVGVSLNAINYKHGARSEITYFNHRAKRVKYNYVYIKPLYFKSTINYIKINQTFIFIVRIQYNYNNSNIIMIVIYVMAKCNII